MKLLLTAVFCTAVVAAVYGKSYDFKNCIRMDVNGTVTLTAKNTKTNQTAPPTVIDLSSDKANISGDCSKLNSSVTMTVTFDKEVKWVLVFNSTNNQVELNQSVIFVPATLFNSTSVNGSLTLSNTKPWDMLSSNASFLCDTQQPIPFTPKEEGSYTFTVSQNITYMHAQAFNLNNGSFSPAEHCESDKTSVAPTTEVTTVPATTEPVPTGKPVTAETFVLKDSTGVVCFRLEAGLQFAVQYETTDNETVFSNMIPIPDSADVTGTCASDSDNTATIIISGTDYNLTFTETRSKGKASSAVKLSVRLDSVSFPKAANASQIVSFEKARTFELSSADTFYRCDTEQRLTFNNTGTIIYANNVQLQAFNLNNGSFSGKGVRCEKDPKPSPMPPASSPGDNSYFVRKNDTVICISLKGEIFFTNVTYTKRDGSNVTIDQINIPAMNESTQNVSFNGSCSVNGSAVQQLVIFFNTNWTVTLTFGSADKESSMLSATPPKEFSLQAVEFRYHLRPDIFPNATNQNHVVVASQTNITGFMKGSGGGSYKCNAQQTETLNNGIKFETANLQYKAFNNDNSTSFNDNVTECSADDTSNSIVPIAVGAALAGLVAVVLIAYLIGRRRSRRQGYESV
ncbi:lysosome-associated membrane glycoprotein 1-like [Babylonia areolata]|uniref:lysosome-associated membrane glycoprotein 1-like n=1 Tax=Babylonia areolata TaxID=304850 RepID=UPI003FD55FE3